MVKVMNGGLPRLAKFVAIFAIEVIRMFFNFKGFTNEMRGVMRGMRLKFLFGQRK
jgi:hypothetical protein